MDAAEYTYEDAGRACGVSAETIRQRARRGKLRRGRETNTGRPTVLLTEQDIAAIAAGRPFIVQADGQPSGQVGRPDVRPSGQIEQPDVQPSAALVAVQALEGEAAALRDALDRERARVDQQQVELVELRGELASRQARLERIEADLTAARGQVEAETARRLEAHDGLARAIDDAIAVRRELDAWTAGGPLTRAWRAFRGRG